TTSTTIPATRRHPHPPSHHPMAVRRAGGTGADAAPGGAYGAVPGCGAGAVGVGCGAGGAGAGGGAACGTPPGFTAAIHCRSSGYACGFTQIVGCRSQRRAATSASTRGGTRGSAAARPSESADPSVIVASAPVVSRPPSRSDHERTVGGARRHDRVTGQLSACGESHSGGNARRPTQQVARVGIEADGGGTRGRHLERDRGTPVERRERDGVRHAVG